MHTAPINQVSDRERLAALIAERGFAVLVGCTAKGRPAIAHTPVLLKDGVLRFHVNRTSALALEDGAVALAVVNGPDAYVSPDWYGEPDQVPTWNYLSAEIEGPVRRMDEAGLAQLLDDLSAHFEARLLPKRPWTRGKMSAGRFEGMLKAIVGYEMTVERIEGVEKLSGNKKPQSQAAAAAHMAEQPDAGSKKIAALMAAQANARKSPP